MPSVWETCCGVLCPHTHSGLCPVCREDKAFYCIGVKVGLWSRCSMNGDMWIQKAFLPVAVSEPRGKRAYTCGGCVSNTTISDTPSELAMDSVHRSPCGQICNFLQKKNGVVYLRKVGPGGDLRTQMTMETYLWWTRSWRMEDCSLLGLSVAHQPTARSVVSSSFLGDAGKSQMDPACKHKSCRRRLHLSGGCEESTELERSFKVLSDLESMRWRLYTHIGSDKNGARMKEALN